MLDYYYYLKTLPSPLLVLLKIFDIHNDTVAVSFDSTKFSRQCVHTAVADRVCVHTHVIHRCTI